MSPGLRWPRLPVRHVGRNASIRTVPGSPGQPSGRPRPSAREDMRAVLACVAEGAAHRDEVPKQLHLSVNTVRTHLQNLTHDQTRRPLDGGSCCPHQGQPGLASRDNDTSS